MTTPRRIGIEERRARLGLRHHLAPAARATSAAEVALDLVGLHGTDPASVYLAAAARLQEPEVSAIERALYVERTLVRILGMRRTMFTVPIDLAPIVQAACTQAIAVQERHKLIQMLTQAGVGDDTARWLEQVEALALRALAARGEATAAELSRDEPRLGQRILLAEGKSYQGWQSIATRVLFLLAADGRIIRVRPRGSWISSQYQWSLTEFWLPGGLPKLPTEAAQTDLVRRWLAAFGPGTVADLRWWTGWTAGPVRRALLQLGAVEVAIEPDGMPGFVLPEDSETEQVLEPWVALLPGLDPTVMGWSGRDWYLGAHGPALFDRSGNAGPTIWWAGRIVGGWAQRRDGQVVFRLLEDVGAEGVLAVQAEAERLGNWLGTSRVTPRFRTPLERELSG